MKKTIFDKSRKGLSPSYNAPNTISVELELPELSEQDVVRHYTALSLESHGVDNGSYPLGSCTMKYNPKRNDAVATLPGFQYIHPEQPPETLNGLWEILYNLQNYIAEITGTNAVSLQPAAGAQGELAGLLIIKKFFENKKENRPYILVADSAHGTNLASAAMAGFHCKIVPTNKSGTMDIDILEKSLDDQVAALMLTNPSTLGLFEDNIERIAQIVHSNNSLLYYDGANLNALIGLVKPGNMGFDIVHINTHKTLSTPHGGGGPGAGPIGVKQFLSDFLPYPLISKVSEDQYRPNIYPPQSIGRIKSYYGHIDVLIRAYAYLLSTGRDDLHQIAEDAILNANYIQHQLKDILPAVYSRFCMHECLLKTDLLPLSAFDLAKRLIDYGVHPPTLLGAGCVYFPGELKSAMLVEPTETESKENLDKIVNTFRKVVEEASSNPDLVVNAPYSRSVSKIMH